MAFSGAVKRCALLLLAAALLLPAHATDACAGHRNKIDGVSTTETDSTITTATAHITGCGNSVSGNTLVGSHYVDINGNDNLVSTAHVVLRRRCSALPARPFRIS